MNIAYIVGARPNYVKMAPLLACMSSELPRAHHLLINTGQHYDSALSSLFIESLGMPDPDIELGVGSGSQVTQTARIMEALEPVLVNEAVDLVIVPGDVNSTLAAALAAAKLSIPVVHLEAGLRSWDRSMPEELNRLLVDRISDLLLVHSPEAIDNLVGEGIPAERIAMVGNTMIDSLEAIRDRFTGLHPEASFGLSPGSYLLVTLHRPALVDGPLLAAAMDRLSAISEVLPVLFPMHPRTLARLADFDPPANLHVCGPVGYLDFLALQANSAGVLTDSGGVQEETTYMSIPCFTLRDNTERPITLSQGTNVLLGLDPEAIETIPARLKEGSTPDGPPHLWDGRAAQRATQAIIDAGLINSSSGGSR